MPYAERWRSRTSRRDRLTPHSTAALASPGASTEPRKRKPQAALVLRRLVNQAAANGTKRQSKGSRLRDLRDAGEGFRTLAVSTGLGLRVANRIDPVACSAVQVDDAQSEFPTRGRAVERRDDTGADGGRNMYWIHHGALNAGHWNCRLMITAPMAPEMTPARSPALAPRSN